MFCIIFDLYSTTRGYLKLRRYTYYTYLLFIYIQPFVHRLRIFVYILVGTNLL